MSQTWVLNIAEKSFLYLLYPYKWAKTYDYDYYNLITPSLIGHINGFSNMEYHVTDGWLNECCIMIQQTNLSFLTLAT